jgi:hypothetical protein
VAKHTTRPVEALHIYHSMQRPNFQISRKILLLPTLPFGHGHDMTLSDESIFFT